jgi:2-iminobutanoate/2-iminopropanoate deaminase
MKASSTKDAAGAIGPYVQGVRSGGWIFVSGQIGLDPKTGRIVDGGIAAETRRALENVSGILSEAGASLERVVRATVYLIDLEEFDAMNRVYEEVFGNHRPARVCVEVSRLPKGARVEIDAIAEGE